MIRRSLTLLALACSLAAALGAAYAQAAPESGAATGAHGWGSDLSRQAGGQINHNNWTYDRSTELGSAASDTATTSSKDYLGNSGGLAPTTTALTAPASVNNQPLPSGEFSLGFGAGSAQPYTGPYKGGPYGGQLPQTSTSSVDLDVTSLSGMGGFKIEKPNEFQNTLKTEGAPGALNEQGGTDDKFTGF